jgi:LysR family transcriptional regulator (chromosome initiation inhibitor)
MLDYPALRTVATVVQTGSFERAAKVLNVTPSAVSQRVKLLEERLGVVVIERGVPCTATERGEWLCRHMEHVGMLETELMANLPGLVGPSEPTPRVTLNIATNSDSLATWFLPAVAAFTRASDYLLKVAVDDEDHTVEWLQRGRVLAAVTSIAKPVQGCRAIRLGALRYHATASPDYVQRHFSTGVTLEALQRAPAITFNQKDRLQHEWIRRTLGGSIAYPTHWLPSTQSFIDASLLGIGWGLNLAKMARAHLGAGRLVELIPGAVVDVPLYWQVNRLAADRLADLTRKIVETAGCELTQTASTTSTSPAISMSWPPSREVAPRRRRKG